MSQNFVSDIRRKAAARHLRVALPDANDIRAIKAAIELKRERIAVPLLVGSAREIEDVAKANGISIADLEIADPATSTHREKLANVLYEKRKAKGMTPEAAAKTALNQLYFAGLLLDADEVQACVGGNIAATGDLLRAAIHTVGVATGISIVSSYFIMVLADRLLCFADCAVVPEPDEAQLCDIAISSARNFQAVTGEEPRVAMLSFSTKGSAEHPRVEKVQKAAKLLRERAPEIPSDGELQVDSALVASVGLRKCPGSPVAGKANVLIFPDLDSGNIGYKLTQRLAGAEAIGPIVQGLRKPYCDLSRGCSVDDMINVAAICSLMA
ncbi:MAG: phosphate acetyltransferase [Acidobacteriota bacterium]